MTKRTADWAMVLGTCLCWSLGGAATAGAQDTASAAAAEAAADPAQAEEMARQHFSLGRAQYQSGAFPEAAASFEQAYSLSKRARPPAQPAPLRSRPRAARGWHRTSSPARLAAVREAIAASVRERHPPRHAQHQVAVYAPGGEPELIFVWPRLPPHDGRDGALRRALLHASWRSSLAAASEHGYVRG